MKISVNNEREKELFEKFTNFLSDYIDSKEMIELMESAGYVFKEHEINYLQTGLNYNAIVTDKTVWDIMISTDNLTGTCKYCGGEWRGIEDVSEANIYDYEHFLNLEKDESYHRDCYLENLCLNCGSDEDTRQFKDEGMLCADCRRDYEKSE